MVRSSAGWYGVLMVMVTAASLTAASGTGLRAQAQEKAAAPADLLKDPAVKAALDYAKAHEDETIANQIRFCEVPAPSFKETARGEVLKQVFQEIGLENVRVDKA